MKNSLDKHNFFKPFRKTLITEFGREEAEQIWEDASRELDRIIAADPSVEDRNGAMVIPIVALYKALEVHGKDAEELLNSFWRSERRVLQNSFACSQRRRGSIGSSGKISTRSCMLCQAQALAISEELSVNHRICMAWTSSAAPIMKWQKNWERKKPSSAFATLIRNI